MLHREERQARILPVAFMKASMSALLPMETRPTVGHTGQRGPAICTPAALYIAPISLADLVLHSTMIMLASLGPVTFKPRLVRKSTVMARFSIISLRRALISAVAVRLAVAQAVVGIAGPLPRSYTSTFLSRSGRAIT